jgi:hypothetical protein
MYLDHEQFAILTTDHRSIKSDPDQETDDDDPCDVITDGPELGVLVRTDYSDEDAWMVFFTKLQECEKDLAEEAAADPDDMQEDVIPSDNKNTAPPAEDDEMDEDSESDDADDGPGGGEPTNILKVVNSTSTEGKIALTHISNLTALRLLNEVDIRPVSPPKGTSPVSPPNRLIDRGGWQEVYEGKSLWIYDEKSNSDQSVRVVSQRGDVYGTATCVVTG